ncbi:hypothetical protein D9M69_580240 [compost metagenome]
MVGLLALEIQLALGVPDRLKTSVRHRGNDLGRLGVDQTRIELLSENGQPDIDYLERLHCGFVQLVDGARGLNLDETGDDDGSDLHIEGGVEGHLATPFRQREGVHWLRFSGLY